jgi:hypothetical protein
LKAQGKDPVAEPEPASKAAPATEEVDAVGERLNRMPMSGGGRGSGGGGGARQDRGDDDRPWLREQNGSASDGGSGGGGGERKERFPSRVPESGRVERPKW